ncbi:alpha-ketoglutarate-dependent dioxygenase AlkB family protein [Halomonas sp. V046]|uniref:alpha-ketoglutarate-dependent dioxygenase AlkB family protein n=1 Tax=Halomonas sp. V046 TaxID=3459611 RepID=UPI004043CD3C
MSHPLGANTSRVLGVPAIDYAPDFLAADEADRLLAELTRALPWHQPRLRLYGREHPIPRQQVWMGDSAYRYSGKTFTPTPWHPSVRQLRDHLERSLASQAGTWRFNSVLLNRYRDGTDRMGWHSDDEPQLGPTPCIAAVTLGVPRPLRFRFKDRSASAFNVWLEHGSLLLMGAGVQERLEHALLPRKIEGERLNLTFRWLQ